MRSRSPHRLPLVHSCAWATSCTPIESAIAIARNSQRPNLSLSSVDSSSCTRFAPPSAKTRTTPRHRIEDVTQKRAFDNQRSTTLLRDHSRRNVASMAEFSTTKAYLRTSTRHGQRVTWPVKAMCHERTFRAEGSGATNWTLRTETGCRGPEFQAPYRTRSSYSSVPTKVHLQRAGTKAEKLCLITDKFRLCLKARTDGGIQETDA